MQRQAASTLSIETLVDAWNGAYAGYFVPLNWNAEQLAEHLKIGSIDLEHSLVWSDDEGPCAISLFGVRSGRGWIGGFGIAPRQRGRGLGQKLFDEHIDHIAALELDSVQLEVIEQNWARKIYERAGFVVTRRLLILAGECSSDSRAKACDPSDALPLLVQRDVPAVWQREPEAVAAQMGVASAAVTSQGEAAAVWRLQGAVVRVIDAAARDGVAASELLRAVGSITALPLRLVNEPEGSVLHRAALELGFTTPLAQVEMKMTSRGSSHG